MHRLVLGWLNCPEVAAPDLIAVAADAGFDGVGLRITGRKPGDGLPSIVGESRLLASIRTRAADRGVAIHNVSAYHVYPQITQRELEPVLDATAALGASLLLVACYDADHVRFAGKMAAIGDAAAARGIRLFLEFVPFSECRTLAQAVAIVAAVGKPNFGMIVDPLHLARSGGGPGDLAAIPRERLFFVQLCDAPKTTPAGVGLPAEARGMRLAPGDGALPLARLYDLVPDDIDVECEFPTQANLALPPLERARGIRLAAQRFFERHAAAMTR